MSTTIVGTPILRTPGASRGCAGFDLSRFAWKEKVKGLTTEDTGDTEENRDLVACGPLTTASKRDIFSYQMVGSARDFRISRSEVSRERPSTNAVAPMTRSAGSLGYAAGRANALTHTRPVIGRTTNRRSTSDRNDSRLMSSRIRPLLESVDNSRSVMSEMARPFAVWRASSIAALAFLESRVGSRASQTTTWVSTRINRVRPSL